MNTTKERLVYFLKNRGLSQRNFERLCKLPNGYVNNIRQTITAEKMQQIILQFKDVNPVWLLTGEGEMERNNTNLDVIQSNCGIPYYPTNIAKLQEVNNIKPSYKVDFMQFNTADLWVNFVGNSMEPLICNGDIVALKKIDKWSNFILFGEVYVIETPEFNVARIITQGTTEDQFKLIPINKNEEFREQQIDKSFIKSIYAVKGVVKQLM